MKKMTMTMHNNNNNKEKWAKKRVGPIFLKKILISF